MTSSGNRSGTSASGESTLQDDLSGMADTVRAEVRRELERVREAAGEMVDRGRESVERVRENVSDRVRERPLTSVLIAGGIGVLLGMLAARRRND
jgi:ElaB/YqjD/DUF883 family membrane-anchored ribosome-binding protein